MQINPQKQIPSNWGPCLSHPQSSKLIKSMNLSKATRAISAKRGFVLIVTLSLMILLTVIAVGLLTLSSITLRSSAQGQAAAEARANARLALMMAIGELQKEMGPDSRISAPHDAGTTATGGQPHWTAVYDAWKHPTDPNTPETPGGAVSPTRAPRSIHDVVIRLAGNSQDGIQSVGGFLARLAGRIQPAVDGGDAGGVSECGVVSDRNGTDIDHGITGIGVRPRECLGAGSVFNDADGAAAVFDHSIESVANRIVESEHAGACRQRVGDDGIHIVNSGVEQAAKGLSETREVEHRRIHRVGRILRIHDGGDGQRVGFP